MNWAKIRDLYVGACGQNPAAANEAFTHLSEAYHSIAARLNVQELLDTDKEMLTVVGQDYVEMPAEFRSVYTIVNTQTGEKLMGEPTGMRGRMLYCEPETGKPAEACPQWWVVANGRIYLRPTPDEAYFLKVLGKSRPPEVTREMLEEEPIFPTEYHMAIVFAAAVSFLRLHPEISRQLGDGAVKADLESQVDRALLENPLPKQEENLDKRDRFALRMLFGRGRF